MHPIKRSEISSTTIRECAVVKAKSEVVDGRTTLRLLGDGVFVVKHAEMLRIPDRIEVLSPDGDQITPTEGRAFLMSADTFDPFHLVTEW